MGQLCGVQGWAVGAGDHRCCDSTGDKSWLEVGGSARAGHDLLGSLLRERENSTYAAILTCNKNCI